MNNDNNNNGKRNYKHLIKYCNLLQNWQNPFTAEIYRSIYLSCILLRTQLGRSIAKQVWQNLLLHQYSQFFSERLNKEVCVEPPPSALDMTLPAFAAGRRRTCSTALAAVDRYLAPAAGRSAANPPAAAAVVDRRDRQTTEPANLASLVKFSK